MKVDPATERARSVVMLVVLTVAVPSLLLTALGAVAVENEEAAARKRLEQVYSPVLWDVAGRFNQRIDRLVLESAEPFEELVAFAREEGVDATKIDAFVRNTDHLAANYFVIDPSGEVLVPRSLEHEPATASLAPGFEKALLHEHANHGRKSACATWAQMKDGCTGLEDQRCIAEIGHSMCQLATGGHDAYRFSEDCRAYLKTSVARAALKGAALEREHLDRLLENARELPRVSRDTITTQPPPLSKRSREQLVEHARELARLANDPTEIQPPLVTRLAALRMIGRLENDRSAEAQCARDVLRSVAERGPFLEYLKNLSHPRDSKVQVQSIETGDWRRVIVSRSIDGYSVGFELAPCGIEAMLNQDLADKQLEDAVRAQIHSIQIPKPWVEKVDWDEYESRVAAWVLLKKTNLAWKLVLLLEDQAGVLSVTRSRSTLYFWALILIASALVAGIGYTVRTFATEARLARLKTDFVSSVSHDLRTPLTSIRMFTETLLLGRAVSKEEEREFLQVIADETDRLSRLTERILDFSRMEAGKKAYQFVPADVSDLVAQALRACRPMIEEAGFEVTTVRAEDLPSLDVDRDAIVEVLINLISNAIKYSPDERSIAIRAFGERDRVGISVTDRGLGIAKAEQCRIFEKFYRVDSRRACEVGGTGLGLSLVRHIVTAHGGEVTVDSTLGAGSTFTVWFPAPRELMEPVLEVGSWRASSS